MKDAPRIHHFEEPLPLDGAAARRWLGGKGASVAQMTAMALPVPPGFTLSTDVWRALDAEGAVPADVLDALPEHVARLEKATGLRYGDPEAPLLLSVRSGGPTSMPGMLDTVLDVGLNGAVARGLAQRFDDAHFALDVRRRFLESYATVVLGVPHAAFDALLGHRSVEDLEHDELGALVTEMERTARHESGVAIPEDPWDQLREAVHGVLRSWRSERAAKFRDAHHIADDEGTGVTVQAMVFGNLSERSGAGVVFSRNPATGEKKLYGEWLPSAQGEDVVSGRRTPQPLMHAQVRRGMEDDSLEAAMPEITAHLADICETLEQHYGDVQDVEFTIERGALWVLQCRSAKRTPKAAVRVAADMVDEGALDKTRALRRLDPASLRQLLVPGLPDPERLAAQQVFPLARGLAASPGAASGKIVLDVDAAERARGEELILVRAETSAEDVAAMRHSHGILTAAGGLTSHAAVVARAMGKPCVAGATTLHVDYVNRRLITRDGRGTSFAEGDVLTIDGARGLVYSGEVAVEAAAASPHVTRVLEWARDACRSQVIAEAGSARQVLEGRRFGADGALVRVHDPEAIDGLHEAVGEGALYLVVNSREVLDALRPRLRESADSLLLPPELLDAAGDLPRWRLHEKTEWHREGGPGVLFAFDERAGARLESLREEGVDPVALLVPPLDVPVARVLAAQVEGREQIA